jgi:predicted RNase H-like HicB family nuclease
MDYIAYLHKDRKSDFGVSFPDFPGCVTAGRTLEEARRKAEEVLVLHIQGMAEDGDAIPKPSKLDEITDDPDRNGAVAILVNANLEKTVRVNITARESQIAKIDRLAEQAGLSRSAYIVRSAIKEEEPRERTRPASAYRAKAGRNRNETRVFHKSKRSRHRSTSR